MSKHSFKEWLIATRPWSFPMSSMSVIVTVVFLLWKGSDIDWLSAVLALLGMVIFHAAGNLLSDWSDYRNGVDNEKSYGVDLLVFHKFEPKEFMCFFVALITVGVLIGLALCLMAGWELLIVGVIGFLLTLSYTFFKYRAMGDIFVFTCFSILPMLGTSFVTTGAYDFATLWVALPLGIITIAVLHNNNTVDISTDKECGIHTVPIAIGAKVSAVLYVAYMVLPYLCVILACFLGGLPWWALTCLLSAPVAYKNASQTLKYFTEGRDAIKGLDEKTAQLHMIFSLTMSAGMLLAYFI